MLVIKKEKINLKEITKALKQRKVIICPTDTVYGLVGDAMDGKAVRKIFKIKKREKTKPVPIFIKDLRAAKKFARIDKKQEKILKSVWPGKITVVLKPKIKFPQGIGKTKKEIGLRIPDYKIVNQLLKACSFPLTGTSANISGKPASTKIKEVVRQFENEKFQPDLVIDVGNLSKSKSSMILDLTTAPPKILRN